MKITLNQISVRDLTDGYNDMDDEGVVAYHGLLNVRPKYQRNFVYDDKKRNAVIRSIQKNFPINVMYWAVNPDGTYEMLDGQQRTISICEYVGKKFSLANMFFQNLTDEEKNQILDYQLQVYFCEGTDREKLDWFQIINIATEKLTDQELRNAIYTGRWLDDAKRKFSKRNCVASLKNRGWVTGDPNRQMLLEKVLLWKGMADGLNGTPDNIICQYMASHQFKNDANEEWQYFQKVLDWARMIFTNERLQLKGQPWGELYNTYHNNSYNSDKIESAFQSLLMDDDVTNDKGIVPYLLSRDEKYLNIRAFSQQQKRTMYETQKGICPACGKHFELEDMEADHKKPWVQGGKTEIANGQMLCRDCNRKKSDGTITFIGRDIYAQDIKIETYFEK